MQNICTAFARVTNIRFNLAKSHCIRFSRHPSCVEQFPVELQSMTLSWTDQILHLGHELCLTLDDSSDISACHRDFCLQANYFFAWFNHIIQALKCHLFLTYRQSFYGSQIWDLQNASLNALDIFWRKVVRLLGGVPNRTYRHLLPYLMSGNNFVSIFATRFVSFFNSCFSSLNIKISFIAHNACILPQHHFCNNLCFVHNLFHNQHNLFYPAGNVLCELLLVRSNCFNINILDISNIDDLIMYICCVCLRCS